MDFKLDNKLERDSLELVKFGLSEVRLYKDSELLWLILIPRRARIIEWMDLGLDEQMNLAKEIHVVASVVKELSLCDKINIGSLGNIVRQFHFHIVGRFENDRAWPGPIWGTSPRKVQSEDFFLNRAKEVSERLIEKYRD